MMLRGLQRIMTAFRRTDRRLRSAAASYAVVYSLPSHSNMFPIFSATFHSSV
jgi:hypothetical protein